MDEQPKKKISESNSTESPAQSTYSRSRKETLQKYIEEIEASLLPRRESMNLAEEAEAEINYDKENTKLDFDNRVQRSRLRERWNTALLSLVILGFGTSYILILFIGMGWLNFGESAFAVPSVIAAGVLQTYGLAKLAVQYFFSDDSERKDAKKLKLF